MDQKITRLQEKSRQIHNYITKFQDIEVKINMNKKN